MVLQTRVLGSRRPSPLPASRVARDFRKLLEEGVPFRCAGAAKDDPQRLLRMGFTPKFRISLFETDYYLSGPRQNPDLRYFVVYVVQHRLRSDGTRGQLEIYPRIAYKDISLIWRVGSHLVLTEDELWVGKGDTREIVGEDGMVVVSEEATTDLPFEVQDAFERLNQRYGKVPHHEAVLPLVLRTTQSNRIEAYADFTRPRRWAEKESLELFGEPPRQIVSFDRPGDPKSLRIVRGFRPDWREGRVERRWLRSSFFGGRVERHRVLSQNRKVQYLFYRSPHHAWAIPPQTLGTELSSYGVRTVTVPVDDDAFVPGYEYHFMDDAVDPPALHTQIPGGFAGEQHPRDENRADASAWLERLSLIRDFRAAIEAP